MEQLWTIKKLLDWMCGYFGQKSVDSPRLTAEMLLSFVLGCKRIDLYVKFNEVVEKKQLTKLRELVSRCAANEPVQYLVGSCEFYSMTFNVSKDCLIPRPETELLVERAIEFLRTRDGRQYVCDLCTGSGCIAAAVAKNYPDCKVIATDICDKALAVAAENMGKFGLTEQVELLCGDLFSPVISQLDTKQFDLLTCNPPYVSDAEYETLDAKVKDYEPPKALLAGADGLDIYKRIVAETADYLKPQAMLLLEIGYLQSEAVVKMLENNGNFSSIVVEKDFNGNDRIVSAVRN